MRNSNFKQFIYLCVCVYICIIVYCFNIYRVVRFANSSIDLEVHTSIEFVNVVMITDRPLVDESVQGITK